MLCDSTKCVACGACMTICPNNCIEYEFDARGYSQPVINTFNCIECGLCERACPILNPYEKQNTIYPRVYCASSIHGDILLNSASGGVATEITRLFIEDLKGYACGVINGKDNIPCFVLLNSESDYRLVSGSRYVHSRTDGIYQSVKNCLDSGEKVFFCGLPCQVAGMYSFMGRDDENLYTADIVCHGCSEERVYKDYLEFIENKNGNTISDIVHTSKDKGWSILIQRLMKISFKGGNVIYRWSQQDPYLSLFLDGSIYRPSCYECRYANFPRVGDITLGDFFGIGTINEIKNLNKNGVSMVMINTDKGHKLFDMVLPYLVAEERDVKEAVYYNLNLWKPSKKNKKHYDFEKNNDIDWELITKQYYNSFSDRVKRFIRKTIKFVIGDKNTARLMLLVYKHNGTTEKADLVLEKLKSINSEQH